MSWQYLAGFLDGEGTIVVRDELQASSDHIRRRYRVALYQNNSEVLLEIQEFLAKYKITSHLYVVNRKDARHNRGHVLEIRGAGLAYRLLLKIEPYLRVKEQEADQAIRFINELIETANDSETVMAPMARATYLAIERE
jgi:intein/homing endonuclease